MPNRKTIPKICEWCDEEFYADIREVKRGNARFCSRNCAASHRNAARPRSIQPHNCVCEQCGLPFYRKPSAQRGGLYCSPRCFYEATHPLYTCDQLIEAIIDFFQKNKRIPLHAEFCERPEYPHPDNYVVHFGSWNEGIQEAGFKPNHASIGYMCQAKDGHPCRSYGEKQIDDWLFRKGIPHDKEVPYPCSRMIADWRIFNAYIEYFGLDTSRDNSISAEYLAKIELKRAICLEWDIDLIEIFPRHVFGPLNALDQNCMNYLRPRMNGKP